MITAERSVPEEIKTIHQLFEAGLNKLHIRKPHEPISAVRQLIRQIDQNYWDRLVIHEHHALVQEMDLGGFHIKGKGTAPKNHMGKHVSRSFHAFEEIERCNETLQYGFISPIFNSISKVGYHAGFDLDELTQFVGSFKRFPLYALGGIAGNNLSLTRKMGFQGAALLGAIWREQQTKTRLDLFHQLTYA